MREGKREEGRGKRDAQHPKPDTLHRLPWIKPRSLRAQLALWHGGLLALTLLALAGFTYLLLREFFNSRADDNLERHATDVAREIASTIYQYQTRNPGKEISKEEER